MNNLTCDPSVLAKKIEQLENRSNELERWRWSLDLGEINSRIIKLEADYRLAMLRIKFIEDSMGLAAIVLMITASAYWWLS